MSSQKSHKMQGTKIFSLIEETVLEVSLKNGKATRITLTDTQFFMIMKCLGMRFTENDEVMFWGDRTLMNIMSDERFLEGYYEEDGGK